MPNFRSLFERKGKRTAARERPDPSAEDGKTAGPEVTRHKAGFTRSKPSISPPTASSPPAQPELQALTAFDPGKSSEQHNAIATSDDAVESTTNAPSAASPDPTEAHSLWDDAYDALRSGDSKALVEKYEDIVAKEIAKSNKLKKKAQPAKLSGEQDEDILPEEVAYDDRALRQRQLASLVKARQDVSEAGSTVKDIAEEAEKVVSALKDKISSALEAYPPAGLSAVVSIKASKENIKGLEYVVSRLTWYGALAGKLLQERRLAADFTSERSIVKNRLLDLFKELIKYEMRSVCYYNGIWNRTKSAAGDQLGLNDWRGTVEDIITAETRLSQDISGYNTQFSLDLAGQQLESSNQIRGLIEQLVRLQEDHVRLEKQRADREERQEDDATKKQINELIQAFSVKGLYYDAFKDNLNPTAEPGTCVWFRAHDSYESWKASSGGLLLVSAPPGCGKSVLMRTLVDETEGRVKREQSGLVCHFFFKDSNLQDQPQWALCALLGQLFKQRRHLVLQFKDAILDEKAETLQGDKDKLWNMFVEAAAQLETDEVYLFLDALDECRAEGRQWLGGKLSHLFRNQPAEPQSKSLRVILTTRPYEGILQLFDSSKMQLIELETGDQEIARIGQEVDVVIDRKLDSLARRSRQPPGPASVTALRDALKSTKNRTYLWVRLVFEIIDKIEYDDEEDWLEPIKSLPKTVDGAYENLLKQVPVKYQQALHVLLSIIYAAWRPLSVKELHLAYLEYIKLEPSSQKVPIKNEDTFSRWLFNTCGFLVHMFEGKLVFIHQTVRDFLRANEGAVVSDLKDWKQSISYTLSHRILAEISIAYLSRSAFFEMDFILTNHPFPSPEDRRSYKFVEDSGSFMPAYYGEFGFLEYALDYWVKHFESAQSSEREEGLKVENFYHLGRFAAFQASLYDIRPSLHDKYLDLFHKPNFCTLAWWQKSYRLDMDSTFPDSLGWGQTTDFIMAVECNHFRLLLKAVNEDQDISVTNYQGKTALHLACDGDDVEMTRWLLFLGASSKDRAPGWGPQLPIQRTNSPSTIQMILLAGGDIDEASLGGDTALHLACRLSRRSTARFLIEHGASVTAVNYNQDTPLHGCMDPIIIEDLVKTGAILDAQNTKEYSANTPLTVACRAGNAGVDAAKKLIELGADVNLGSYPYGTPLHITRNPGVAKALVAKGADRNARIDHGEAATLGKTPLDALIEDLTKFPSVSKDLVHLIGIVADIPIEEDFHDAITALLRYNLNDPNYRRSMARSFARTAEMIGLLIDLVRLRGYPIRFTQSDLVRKPLVVDFRAVCIWPLSECIEWSGIDPSLLDMQSRSLLQAACNGQLLLEMGRLTELGINQETQKRAHLELIEKLLLAGFNPDEPGRGNGLSPLAELLTTYFPHFNKDMAAVAAQLYKSREFPEKLKLRGRSVTSFYLHAQLTGPTTRERVNPHALRATLENLIGQGFPADFGVDENGQNALHYLAKFVVAGWNAKGEAKAELEKLEWQPEDSSSIVESVFGSDEVEQLMEFCIKHGADPRAKSSLNQTPLEILLGGEGGCERGRDIEFEILLSLLCSAGDGPNTQDANGDTWLHDVCSMPNLRCETFMEVTRLVFQLGLQPNIRNKHGETALYRLCDTFLREVSGIHVEYVQEQQSEAVLTERILSGGFDAEAKIAQLLEYGADPGIHDARGNHLVENILRCDEQKGGRLRRLAQSAADK
jgi:ankyrin repeat protein